MASDLNSELVRYEYLRIPGDKGSIVKRAFESSFLPVDRLEPLFIAPTLVCCNFWQLKCWPKPQDGRFFWRRKFNHTRLQCLLATCWNKSSQHEAANISPNIVMFITPLSAAPAIVYLPSPVDSVKPDNTIGRHKTHDS